MNNVLFSLFCLKNNHTVVFIENRACVSFENLYNALHPDAIQQTNLAYRVKLLNVYCVLFITDEVINNSLREYEEQLVWIFTD